MWLKSISLIQPLFCSAIFANLNEYSLNMTVVSESHTVLWVPRYWPAVGGTEFHSHELAQCLSHDHRVTVLANCTSTETFQQPLTQSAVLVNASDAFDGAVRTITLAPARMSAKLLSALGKHHAKSKVARRLYQIFFVSAYKASVKNLIGDADRVHFIYNGLTESAILAAEVASELNIPFIFTPNVLDTAMVGSDWDSAGFHMLYDCADQLIALTTHEANWLASHGVSKSKITVVPYGPILQPRRNELEFGGVAKLLSSRYILFLGRLVPEKGYQLLLQAFEELIKNDSDLKLVMVGPADKASRGLIQAMNKRLGEPAVSLIENVSQPTKTALLEEAQLLCVPSKRESLGGVYIESMASSTPVIALDRPVSHCVIDHRKNGLLVAEDIASVKAGMQMLLDDPTLRADMARAGRIKVDRLYNWRSVTDQILSVYAKVGAESRADIKKAA